MDEKEKINVLPIAFSDGRLQLGDTVLKGVAEYKIESSSALMGKGYADLYLKLLVKLSDNTQVQNPLPKT